MTQPLLIKNGTLITMDGTHTIMDQGYVQIEEGLISAIGEGAAPPSLSQFEVIDARGMVVMPGFVDAHAHAGHMLTKGLERFPKSGNRFSDKKRGENKDLERFAEPSEAKSALGEKSSDDWMTITGKIYAQATDPEFWAAEAALSAVERIKCGTTTCALLLGGGADVMRTEAPQAAEAHLETVAKIGVREVLAVGPNRPSDASIYRIYQGDCYVERAVSPWEQLEVSTALLDSWQGRHDRLQLGLSLPVFTVQELESEDVRRLACSVRDLAREKSVLLMQDGHNKGTIASNDAILGLFDAHSLLSHCIDLTPEDQEVLKRTHAKVAHNPSAIMSIFGRCPAPEMMRQGITVALGTDAAAPDRSFDMFRNMFQAHRYHARHWRDDSILSPEQLLEMATIGGARALSMEHKIGTLEVGKCADMILVNMRQPHLWPPIDPVQRLARFANGADVDTTIVGGRILMRGRKLTEQDEDAILDRADRAFRRALQRVGLAIGGQGA